MQSIVKYVFGRICSKLSIGWIVVLLFVFFVAVGVYKYMQGKEGSYASRVYVVAPHIFTGHNKTEHKTNVNMNQPSKNKESRGETECRRVLESIFSKPFPNSRPSFMKNSVTGSNLEIDCYNDELNLGCEYHGKQHYEYVPYFHKDKQHFYNQRYRDEETKRLCSQNGVSLIEVPYTVKIGDIETYIRKRL